MSPNKILTQLKEAGKKLCLQKNTARSIDKKFKRLVKSIPVLTTHPR